MFLLQPFSEGRPLWLLLFSKSCDKNIRFLRKHGIAALKSESHGFSQLFANKLELLRQKSDIVKIFHAAVKKTKLDHGLKLFGNCAFSAVAKKNRRFVVQYRWQAQPFWFGI